MNKTILMQTILMSFIVGIMYILTYSAIETFIEPFRTTTHISIIVLIVGLIIIGLTINPEKRVYNSSSNNDNKDCNDDEDKR